MPNYPTVTSMGESLSQGLFSTFFDAEQPAPPQASQRFYVPAGRQGGYAPIVKIEGFFSADPGIFEIEIQEAETDEDAAYLEVPSAGVINAVDTNFRFRVDLAPFVGRFIRLLLVSRANAVNLTAKAILR